MRTAEPGTWLTTLVHTACAMGLAAFLALQPRAGQAQCVGDCNADSEVTVDELISMVNISLETADPSTCPIADANGDGAVTVDEIVQAVNIAVNGTVCEGGRCGDGHKDAGEDCDDGGTCIGGADAGMPCTAESHCLGNGACIGGAKIATSCAMDSDCPGSRCVRCRPFGGDGCAANCTTETRVPYALVDGIVMGLDIKPGTSGAVVHGDVLTIPLPLTGTQEIIIGKKSPDGSVPFVVPADSVKFPKIPVSTLACACVRGVSFKSCGGTLFEPDGSQTPSCTEGFMGQQQCPNEKPCTFVHGFGNSATGFLGCSQGGIDGTDVALMQDSGGEGGTPGNVIATFGGHGPMGSAIVLNSTAIGTVVGACPADFCTMADPLEARGTPQTLPFTTATATCKVTNANEQVGVDIGPFSAMGSPADCSALSHTPPNPGSFGLAGAFPALDQPTLGDICVTNQFFFVLR